MAALSRFISARLIRCRCAATSRAGRCSGAAAPARGVGLLRGRAARRRARGSRSRPRSLCWSGLRFSRPGYRRCWAGRARLAPQTIFRLAAENLGRTIHRTGITVAALACAVAMMIGVSVMIYSFRQSVDAWIGRGIVADLYVAPAANEVIGLHSFVPPGPRPRPRSRPRRPRGGHLPRGNRPHRNPAIRWRSAPCGARTGRNLRFVGGGEREKMREFFSGGDAVIVTESFAHRHGAQPGDILEHPHALRHRRPARRRGYTMITPATAASS